MKKGGKILVCVHLFSWVVMLIFLIGFCKEPTSSGETTCPSQYTPYVLILFFIIFITGVILIKTSKSGKTSQNISCTRNIPENKNIDNRSKFTINGIDVGRVVSGIKDLGDDIKNLAGNNIETPEGNNELVNTKYGFSFYKIKDNYITQYECENESIFWYNIACDIYP